METGTDKNIEGILIPDRNEEVITCPGCKLQRLRKIKYNALVTICQKCSNDFFKVDPGKDKEGEQRALRAMTDADVRERGLKRIEDDLKVGDIVVLRYPGERDAWREKNFTNPRDIDI